MSRALNERRHITSRALLALLSEQFPNCFALYAPHRRPLKCGIRDDILAALAGALDAKELRNALRWYCNNIYYLAAIADPPGIRFDLDGKPAGSVTGEQREEARRRIDAIRAKYTSKARAARGVNTKPKPGLLSNPCGVAARTPAATQAIAAAVRRMSIADLRAAAQQRKQALSPP